MKFRELLFITSFSVSLFVPSLLHRLWSIGEWMDSLFLIGLLLLIIFSIMILIEADFFTAFIKSFKHFFARVNKKEEVLREIEKRTSNEIVFRKNFPSRKSFFEIGIFYCAISLLISTVIYYFGR